MLRARASVAAVALLRWRSGDERDDGDDGCGKLVEVWFVLSLRSPLAATELEEGEASIVMSAWR